MGLFSPWFLAGLAALGLPLWLHLLKQFKQTPQFFSSLMFFERQVQSSSKHRRLQYLRLLALRLALLALLALLFADPFVNRAAVNVRSKLTVVAVDRSFSMHFRSRFEEAKQQAASLINRLPGRADIRLAAVDDQTVFLTQPQAGKDAAQEALAGMNITARASSYGGFSRALRVLEQTSGQSLDVHFFTDAQQTSMPAAFTDLQVGSQTSLSIHAVGQGAAPNWAVESVSVPARVYNSGAVRLTAAIAGWQTNDAKRKVSVLLDGRTVASQDVSVPASNRTQVEFNNLPVPFGIHRGEVRIEPTDELPLDDTFPFSVEHADPRKVLFLSSVINNPGTSGSGFFYKAALDAAVNAGLRVQVQTLETTLGSSLAQYAFVVLNNPGTLTPAITQQLTEFVTQGGALLVAAGPAAARAGKLPIGGESVSSGMEPQSTGAIASMTLDALDPQAFDEVQFFSAPRITAAASDRVLAHFANGAPLLLEQRQGEGRILILATTLDNANSDFPLHASFVPFVASTGAYLSGDAGIQPSSEVVGAAVPLRQSKSQPASADVIGPDGAHELPLSEAARAMTFNPGLEGFYDIHRADGRRLLLAVHADRRESNLAQVPEETLNLWRNTGKEASKEDQTTTATVVPYSLWRYLLTLLLLAAVMESVFAARYLSEERKVT